jgi:hypothetical protein
MQLGSAGSQIAQGAPQYFAAHGSYSGHESDPVTQAPFASQPFAPGGSTQPRSAGSQIVHGAPHHLPEHDS